MAEVGRLLLGAGVALAVVGALLLLADRFGVKSPRLPGDIVYRTPTVTVYVPLVSMLVLSLVLTLLLYLFGVGKR